MEFCHTSGFVVFRLLPQKSLLPKKKVCCVAAESPTTTPISPLPSSMPGVYLFVTTFWIGALTWGFTAASCRFTSGQDTPDPDPRSCGSSAEAGDAKVGPAADATPAA